MGKRIVAIMGSMDNDVDMVNYVKKLISVLSHLLVVQQQKLLLSQLLQTIIKELNILSLTLKLHQMLLSLLLI